MWIFLYFSVTPAAFRDGLANTMLGPDVEHWQGVLIELWITFILVTTIIGSTNAKIKGAGIGMPPIIIGYAIALGIMSAVSIKLYITQKTAQLKFS